VLVGTTKLVVQNELYR